MATSLPKMTHQDCYCCASTVARLMDKKLFGRTA